MTWPYQRDVQTTHSDAARFKTNEWPGSKQLRRGKRCASQCEGEGGVGGVGGVGGGGGGRRKEEGERRKEEGGRRRRRRRVLCCVYDDGAFSCTRHTPNAQWEQLNYILVLIIVKSNNLHTSLGGSLLQKL